MVRFLAVFALLCAGAVPAAALTFTETPGDGSILYLEPGTSDEDYARLLISADPVVRSGRTSVSAISDAVYRVSFRYFYDGDAGASSFGYHRNGVDFRVTDPVADSQSGSASFLVRAGATFGWYLASEPRTSGLQDVVGVTADIAPIPVPAGFVLVASGLMAMAAVRRRRG